MRRPRIVVLGSSNTDMVIQAKRLPRPGETVLGGEFVMAAGGKGANQAVAAARAGGAVTFIACLGRDMFGDQALAGFARDGIDVDHVVRDARTPSGVALIVVAQNGENSIAVASGANAKLAPAHARQARRLIASARVLVLQLETPLATVQAAAELAADAGVPVILNPAPARRLPNRLLRCVSVLTPNEREAELLTGIRVDRPAGVAAAASALRDRGVPTVVMTLGRRGAYVASGDTARLVPGFKVKAVDTTGAGDVFNGALAVALGEGRPLLAAVRFAHAAAALSVTRLGAQPSAPRRGAIRSLERELSGIAA